MTVLTCWVKSCIFRQRTPLYIICLIGQCSEILQTNSFELADKDNPSYYCFPWNFLAIQKKQLLDALRGFSK